MLVVAALVPCAAQAAPPVSRTTETSGLELVTPLAQQAIDRGLDRLARSQFEDGSLGSGSTYRRHVAVTALSGIAFLSAGYTPNRGKYGEQVEKIVQYLLNCTDSTGLISAPEHRQQNPMYGHGFATLFLAEVYGMTPRAEIRDKLKLSINLIVNSQNKDGGWRYFPVRKEADVSVTVCQIMALRAARNAGLYVPKSTVELCTKYVKSCQLADGGFMYTKTSGNVSLWPRSAAGLVALYSAGIYEGEEIQKGLKFLLDHQPRGEIFRNEGFYFYGHYYAAQVMWHAGGNYWRQWYPAIRDELLVRQTQDGSWMDHTVNSEYATAMACIVLQMPNNYLPIFQR
ncbi:MAG: terpene cyclase/mutase family protein [Planctomycetes bacterium]|nr:terpene cyclase/mutase family protein [Planctomycetota bacterium]